MEEKDVNAVKEEGKMKNWVMVRPRKGKEWLVCFLMIGTVIPFVSPVINLFNVPVLVFGMPVFLLLALLSLVVVLVVILIALKLEVY